MTQNETPPSVGIAEEVSPGIRCVLAPNPSPMTHWGTNTFLLGTDPIVIVDPGPDDDTHFANLLHAIGAARIEAILITHSHLDHSPLAPRLSAHYDAPVLAYGNSFSGRAPHMDALAKGAEIGGGEGVDQTFQPDDTLTDGQTLTFAAGQIEALWTPGHFGNHMCFAMGDVLFTGDLVMGWASSLVSPPDGDLSHFMASCERLTNRRDTLYLPGHGALIIDPQDRVQWLLSHRRMRETQILNALASNPGTARQIAERIYTDTPERLMPAAARNVLAHLIDLWCRGIATCTGKPDKNSAFHLKP